MGDGIMEAIRLVIYGQAKGKARARTVPIRGKDRRYKTYPGTDRIMHRTYTPASTVEWEDSIRAQAIAQRGGRPLWDGPVIADVWFYLPWPKGLSQKKRRSTVPTTKPDRDNLLKCVKDALNKIIWRDDALVFSGATEKRYGDPPRVEIDLRFLTEAELEELLAREDHLRNSGD
ncbi:MAG: RusA family crossover junction endodeoxyribonuclease [Desulfobacteraceae bacterium]|nr:MAG: RusA family crossover junction endodeoxyribonuclease [Desulfobacteraceae bacterium]